MKWPYKAAVQVVFSIVPFGDRLNELVQRHVTKTIPTADADFLRGVNWAREHVEGLRAHWSGSLNHARFYEFGAGRDLIIPLTFYALGIDDQTLVDIRRLLRADLVNHTLDQFARLGPQAGLPRLPAGSVSGSVKQVLAQLRDRWGIDYRAPCDARRTGFAAESFDCITSTFTLEHIPASDIKEILRECHRVLHPDGRLSFYIDYQDHYSFVDHRISAYNFLKFSDRTWALASPSLHYQNRMRHRDHVALLREAGFEVVRETREDGRPADLEVLERTQIGERFRKYSTKELAIRHALLVLKKT